MKAAHLLLALFAACRGQYEGVTGGAGDTSGAAVPPYDSGTTDAVATVGTGGSSTSDPPPDDGMGTGGNPFDRPGDGDGGTCGMPSLINRDGGGTANKRSDCSEQSDNPMDWRACAQPISGASSGKVARRAAHDAREQPPHYSRRGLIKAKSPPPFVFLTRPPHARRWKPPSRLRATRRR